MSARQFRCFEPRWFIRFVYSCSGPCVMKQRHGLHGCLFVDTRAMFGALPLESRGAVVTSGSILELGAGALTSMNCSWKKNRHASALVIDTLALEIDMLLVGSSK